MKQLRHEMRYDDATAEQVHAMLATPEFREAVCEFQHFPRRTVTIIPAGDGTGGGMEVTIDQFRPVDEVPSFARKFVGDEVNIVQHERWTSPTSAALEVTIPGKPGDMRGNITLAESGGGTTETVAVDITVSIPLVGGKVEAMISDLLTKALRAENKVGRDWLASH